MRSSLQHLETLLQLLDTWGWRRVRQTGRYYLYSPPLSEKDSSFELAVPGQVHTRDFERAITNCVEALASFYSTPFTSIEALLLPRSEVLSVRLQGESFVGGAAPFPQFERMLDHLKRTISRAASFVLTDDPLAQVIPAPARHFVNDCWFLQTARGSFVTRVALPAEGNFEIPQYSMFARTPSKSQVADTIRQVTSLIGERVLPGEDMIFTNEGFDSVRSSVSIGLLEEVGKLLRGSQAESIELTFNRIGDESTVPLTHLSEERLVHVDQFVTFVRERLHAVFELEVTGRIFEVRRSRRGSLQSYVGLEGEVDGRMEYVTFKVEARALAVMLEHFKSRQPLTVRGNARRMRTQIRIQDGFQFEV
jgi:hypothetical protein